MIRAARHTYAMVLPGNFLLRTANLICRRSFVSLVSPMKCRGFVGHLIFLRNSVSHRHQLCAIRIVVTHNRRQYDVARLLKNHPFYERHPWVVRPTNNLKWRGVEKQDSYVEKYEIELGRMTGCDRYQNDVFVGSWRCSQRQRKFNETFHDFTQ